MIKLPKIRFGVAVVAVGALIVAITTIGALLSSIDAPQPTAPKPKEGVTLSDFELATPSQPDPQNQGVMLVSTPDITVEAAVTGIKQAIFLYGLEGASPSRATTSPDSSGRVAVTLHLTQPGVIYVIDVYGIVADKQSLGWEGGLFDERPAIEAPSTLRVRVSS